MPREAFFLEQTICYMHSFWGWSGGAIVLGKFPGLGCPTVWTKVGQGLIVLAVVQVGFVWTFLLSSIFSLLFPLLFGRRPDID